MLYTYLADKSNHPQNAKYQTNKRDENERQVRLSMPENVIKDENTSSKHNKPERHQSWLNDRIIQYLIWSSQDNVV